MRDKELGTLLGLALALAAVLAFNHWLPFGTADPELKKAVFRVS